MYTYLYRSTCMLVGLAGHSLWPRQHGSPGWVGGWVRRSRGGGGGGGHRWLLPNPHFERICAIVAFDLLPECPARTPTVDGQWAVLREAGRQQTSCEAPSAGVCLFAARTQLLGQRPGVAAFFKRLKVFFCFLPLDRACSGVGHSCNTGPPRPSPPLARGERRLQLLAALSSLLTHV